MFQLTDKPIVPPTAACPAAGGFVTFEGRVRASNEGNEVQQLEYEAFDEMAVSEGLALVAEAKRTFGLDWAWAIHRTGTLDVGEVAVWIGCAAAHRKEAFLACEFLIDEMKKRLPIWKKEHYTSGASEWVNLQQEVVAAKLTKSDVFSRHLAMPEVGAEGQVALGRARVLVVGAGGLANAALPYLAAAGVGTIGIVEPDVLEASNLHRQVLFGHGDLGKSKARLAAESLRKMHPFVATEVFEERLRPENADRIIGGFDTVVDGTDRFDAKFLMNDVCQALGKPLVQASIYRFDGYLQTIMPGGPCLRCQWPNEPPDGCVRTCAEAGVLGVTPGLFGILQATETIKLIVGIGESLKDNQLLIDLRDYSMHRIRRVRRLGCSCGNATKPESATHSVPIEVTADEVRGWVEPFVCLDLREEEEQRERVELGQHAWHHTPMSRFSPSDLPTDSRVLLVCASGMRSGRVAYGLREASRDNVFALKGGVELQKKTTP